MEGGVQGLMYYEKYQGVYQGWNTFKRRKLIQIKITVKRYFEIKGVRVLLSKKSEPVGDVIGQIKDDVSGDRHL